MSVFKSTLLVNRDATPKVLTDGFLSGGLFGESQGSAKTGAADAAGTTYRLVSVPSNAKLSSLIWQSDSLGSGCVVDVGVWYPTTLPVGGGAFLSQQSAAVLISSSIFATGLTAPAATALTEITNQSLNYLIPLQETPLWNVLGMLSDPEISFDIGFVARSATAAAGYVGLKARYQF